jgi:lipopolysaccharide transport protein LptA
MALLSPDRLRPLLGGFVLACLCALPGAHSATISSRGNITIEHQGLSGNLSAGTLAMRTVTVRVEDGTLIRADEGSATGVDGGFENSQWEMRGNVHLEFDGAVLDADAAAVEFSAGRLKTVRVQGAPARFSHGKAGQTQRREGRAANIDYQSDSGQVHFFNGTWFTDGRIEYSGGELSYNINTSVLTDDGNPQTREELVLRRKPEARVPPPRTPPRSSSQ